VTNYYEQISLKEAIKGYQVNPQISQFNHPLLALVKLSQARKKVKGAV